MRLSCPISGLTWKAEHMPLAGIVQHPAFQALSAAKIPAMLSLYQQGRLNASELHIVVCRVLSLTDHVEFSSPLVLTNELSQIEAAQIIPLTKLYFSGVFQRVNIQLPSFNISPDSQDISNIIAIWETELESYRISYLISKQEHAHRAMLTRVTRALNEPLSKDRKKVISTWLCLTISLPEFQTLHPVGNYYCTLKEYWLEILHKAIDGDYMLAYPEQDILEFKSHLEENLPLNYSQEFSILEEIRAAISRKQNYFGYSFVDSDEKSYSIDTVKPSLKRADFKSTTDFLNAIKNSRIKS